VPTDRLNIKAYPEIDGARMVLGFTGWMDGGDVSTGTVKYLSEKLGARPLAEIEPRGFYIYSFPGSMEISALFRPHCEITDGIVHAYDPPANLFRHDDSNRLILFSGKEPNLAWEAFADCLFGLGEAFRIRAVYFLGSYAGVVPHTRDPRLYASVSDPEMKAELEPHGFRFTDYEGPAHFATYLTHEAADRGVKMATLVAEIPAYIQGTNPRCIEAVARTIAGVLGIQINTDDLRQTSDGFEAKVNEAIADKDDLSEMIQKMEAQYDSEMFETQMGDLKDWLEDRGIRLD
jgi:proteasome assembly chaperone (PAC2) family protein